MTFDPTQHKPKGGGFRNLTRPGRYLVGITKVQEHGKSSTSGKRFTNFRFVVIDGPEKGASFFDKVFRNPEAFKRLGSWCYAIRNTEKFNPAKDDEVERHFVGRALVLDVEIERGTNGKDYARAKWPVSEYTETQLEALRDWEKAFRERRANQGSSGGYGGGYGGGDDPDPGDFSDDEPEESFPEDDGDDWGASPAPQQRSRGGKTDDIPF